MCDGVVGNTSRYIVRDERPQNNARRLLLYFRVPRQSIRINTPDESLKITTKPQSGSGVTANTQK